MIVTITSWAPVLALSTPAMPAQIAPAMAPLTSATIAWIGQGRPYRPKPAVAAASAPTLNWPSAPMLNSPPRNASATASPARMYGVAQTTVSESESARPSEPSQRPPYANSGSPPVARISTAPSSSAVKTASPCTSSVWRIGRRASAVSVMGRCTGESPPLGQHDVGAQHARLQVAVDLSKARPGGVGNLGLVVVECRQADLAKLVAALERAVVDRGDQAEDAGRDQLHGARHQHRPGLGQRLPLVGVDADGQHVAVQRAQQGAVAGIAARPEDDVRLLLDHLNGGRLAPVRIGEAF